MIQGDVIRMDLEGEHGDIGIEEEIQVRVCDLEHESRAVVERYAHPRDIAAAEHADTRLAVALRGFLPDVRAVEEALHVGQEGHELLVVTLLEFQRVTRVLVVHLAPWTFCSQRLERLPMTLHLDTRPERHELQRPEQNLAEMTHDDGCGCFAHQFRPRPGSAAVRHLSLAPGGKVVHAPICDNLKMMLQHRSRCP